MKGTQIFDGETLYSMQNLAIMALVLLGVLYLVVSQLMYMATLAHLRDAKLISDSIAGAVTSVASAPQRASYCVEIPQGASYDIVIGKNTEKVGNDEVEYGFVMAISPDDKSAGISYMPVTNIDPYSFRVPFGQRYTLVVKKIAQRMAGGGMKERIMLRAKNVGIEKAGCDSVKQSEEVCLS